MSVVKINAIHVPAGAGTELESRFAARKHSVDGADGFEGFQLLRPVKGDERYFVVTTWRDEEAFQAWAENGAKAAHAGPRQEAWAAPRPPVTVARRPGPTPRAAATRRPRAAPSRPVPTCSSSRSSSSDAEVTRRRLPEEARSGR